MNQNVIQFPALGREVPHNVEAEHGVLGAILASNRAYERVGEFLKPEHFYDPVHGRIYAAAASVIDRGGVADAVTLHGQFRDDPALSAVGGAGYLAELAASVVSVRNAEHYGRLVADCAMRRELIEAGLDLIARASAPSPDDAGGGAGSVVEETESRLFELAETGSSGAGPRRVAEFVDAHIKNVYAAQDAPGGIVGLGTGLVDLDRELRGLKPGALVIIAGRPAMGKAQPLDAKVMTPTGWTTMGELKVGDRLASNDGLPSEVTGVFPQGEKPIFRVTFSDGRSTECCGDHLWRVRYRDWPAARVLTTDKVREMLGSARYRNRLSIDLVDGNFGHDDPLPIDPYVLGVLLGDGNFSGMILSSNDPPVLDRFGALLPEGASMAQCSKHDHGIRTGRMDGRAGTGGVEGLRHHLRAFGLRGTRSHEKFVPDIYKTANRHARAELLAGLLDTDGWVEAHASVRFSTSSRRLADDVVDLVRSLGGLCSIKEKIPAYPYKGEKKVGRLHYICRIRHMEADKLFTLARKGDRAKRDRNQTIRLNFSSVEPSRTAPARCISVSHPTRLYVTDDYTLTHNTALALNIAHQVAKDGGTPLFVSEEMPGEELAARLVADLTGIPVRDQFSRLDPEQFRSIEDARHRLSESGLWIDDTPSLTIARVRTVARRHKRRHGLSALLVDYLQLLHGGGRHENRVQEISAISRGLKEIAKELHVPVVALSQLSRAVESREDKRPLLSDLRDGGSIEQDADIVLFPYRAEYYLSRAEPVRGANQSEEAFRERHQEWMNLLEEASGTAEIIIAKFRQGGATSVRVAFDGARTKFFDLYRER